MVKTKPTSKLTSLFDIRLRNLDHNVLVLKGNQHDAASAFLEGKIALSVTEPITIRRVTLRLYGTFHIKYSNVNASRASAKPARFDKKVYEHVWDSADFSKYLTNLYENTAGLPEKGNSRPQALAMSKLSSLKGSTASLKNLGLSFRSKSSTSLAHLSPPASHSSSSTNLAAKNVHTLVLGNYEIPFSAILPGDMPESVEGLPGASVVYKMEATIDRGKFHNLIVTKKHIRVVRTMTTDSVELSETMAVDNTWPKKVEYSISIPQRALAIGLGTPVSLMLVPLLKGLQLGDIKMTLVEMYSYVGYLPPPQQGERVIVEKLIPRPKEDDPNFHMDKWEITTFIRLPVSLSKVTQDCDIGQHLKVRHKMKFVIGLVNPDGHTSELRASLPVQLFISPFVTVRARTEDDESDAGSLDHVENEPEEVLFSSDSQNASATNLAAAGQSEEGGLRSNHHSSLSFTGLVAPPMYEQHVYDRLWSDVSPIESPRLSGSATPRSIHSSRPAGDVLQFSMSSIDTAKLTENLRQLSIQRQLQESMEGRSTPSLQRATFNLDGDSEGGDYFRPRAANTHSGPVGHSNFASDVLTPGIMSPPLHLSRAGSETYLSRVPSYNEAVKSSVDDTLAPAYLPPLPGSHIDLAEINRRFEENTSKSPPVTSTLANSRNRLMLSRGLSSFNLRGSSSRVSSNNSSPANSRNVSSTNLAGLAEDNAAKRGRATFSMTPQ